MDDAEKFASGGWIPKGVEIAVNRDCVARRVWTPEEVEAVLRALHEDDD